MDHVSNIALQRLALAAPSRRRLLRSAVGCAAGLAGGPLLASPHPLMPRSPHAAPRAKNVIWIFMTGGVSHVDSFDPKPRLQSDDGKPKDSHRRGGDRYMASPWKARHRGKSGLEITDLFPEIGSVADHLCLIRSMHGDHSDHFQATLHMHNGSDGSALPGIGSWISYGLGTHNSNLPSHVVFARNKPYAGSQVWGSGFLPPHHQGMRITPGAEPIPNLRPDPLIEPLQKRELELLRALNAQHLEKAKFGGELSARMQSFDAAYAMQRLAPDLFDLARERDATLEMYGVEHGDSRSFGWQCLMARRMVERGVRFVELIDTGSTGNWDAHGDIAQHEPLARKADRPIAGLIRDLAQRGMLDDTLIVWCTEFGRSPTMQSTGGRNHHARVFTCWLAGGGTRGGHVQGASDEYGNAPAADPVHVHDFHATILHLLGLDHKRLTYRHTGRDFRLTDVYGHVVKGVIA